MRKLISAALAAITLIGAGAVAVPAMADPRPYSAERGNDHRGNGRVDDRRGDVRYNEDGNRYHDRGRGRDGHWDRGTRGWRTHVARCERSYRSYSVRSDTYRTYSGNRRRCRL